MQRVAEVEIVGSLLPSFLPRGTPYGFGGNHVTDRCTVAGDVVRQIDAAQAEGVRRLLVRVDCFGGSIPSAYEVAERLRRFSREVGPVIAHVRIADSSAPFVALAADRVVLDETGRFGIHAAAAAPGTDLQGVHERSAAALAARSFLDAEDFLELMRDPAKGTTFAGQTAVTCGLADEIGTLERARELAASDVLPWTFRSRRLRESPAREEEDSATLSSDGGTSQWGPYQTEARLFELAIGNWTKQTIPSSGDYYGVAWGAGLWCAVGTGTTRCATSPDGITWTARTMPSGSFYAVTWAGGQFVAVGNGVCATSPDGITWTSRTIGIASYSGIAWNGSIYCAVSLNGYAVSSDGITWTTGNLPGSGPPWINAVAWSRDLFCAVGAGRCLTSPDGTTWTARDMSAVTSADAIVWTGMQFVTVGGTVGGTSPDGITWTARTLPSAGLYRGAVWTGLVLVAVGSSVTAVSACATSIDGVNWTAREPVEGVGCRAAAFNGRRLVVVGNAAAARSLEA